MFPRRPLEWDLPKLSVLSTREVELKVLVVSRLTPSELRVTILEDISSKFNILFSQLNIPNHHMLLLQSFYVTLLFLFLLVRPYIRCPHGSSMIVTPLRQSFEQMCRDCSNS